MVGFSDIGRPQRVAATIRLLSMTVYRVLYTGNNYPLLFEVQYADSRRVVEGLGVVSCDSVATPNTPSGPVHRWSYKGGSALSSSTSVPATAGMKVATSPFCPRKREQPKNAAKEEKRA